MPMNSNPSWTVSGGILVCADVNARSAMWHDTISDGRGDIVVDLNGRKNLTVLNQAGYPPTFRNRGSACLDVTLASKNVRTTDWSAVHDLTSSDHAVISFGIIVKDYASPATAAVEPNKYNWKLTDWEKFRKTLVTESLARSTELESPDVETCAIAISGVLATACTAHMKRVSTTRKHKVPP